MKEFLAMGGYAAYVWSCFGLTLVVLWINHWTAKRRLTAVQTELAKRHRHAAKRRQQT